MAVFLLALAALVHVGWRLDHAAAQSNSKSKAVPAEKQKRSTPAEPRTAGPTKAVAPTIVIRKDIGGLPAPVLEMRDAILSAVDRGQISDLRIALELNEIAPIVADAAIADPIAHWRKTSNDGEGYEILAILADLLAGSYAVVPLGSDLENNRVYVWPALAELPFDKLSPAQHVELLRLVPAAAAREMIESKRYTHYRIGIGADGTWHYFNK